MNKWKSVIISSIRISCFISFTAVSPEVNIIFMSILKRYQQTIAHQHISQHTSDTGAAQNLMAKDPILNH
ncbi:hypothetical protein T06_11578 [Trichinella sp. T6]|nr:hypothetical protein T06_11578 [Trichinella sp. T6]